MIHCLLSFHFNISKVLSSLVRLASHFLHLNAFTGTVRWYKHLPNSPWTFLPSSSVRLPQTHRKSVSFVLSLSLPFTLLVLGELSYEFLSSLPKSYTANKVSLFFFLLLLRIPLLPCLPFALNSIHTKIVLFSLFRDPVYKLLKGTREGRSQGELLTRTGRLMKLFSPYLSFLLSLSLSKIKRSVMNSNV